MFRGSVNLLTVPVNCCDEVVDLVMCCKHHGFPDLPFLQFAIKGAKAGDKIAVTWKDNKGESRTDEATVS